MEVIILICMKCGKDRMLGVCITPSESFDQVLLLCRSCRKDYEIAGKKFIKEFLGGQNNGKDN